MSRALLSLGSNLGDRQAALREAVAGLGEAVLITSGVYESEPWPAGEQVPRYLNAAVLVIEPGADPYHWLRQARRLEQAAGRERAARDRHLPRVLDVDVIMVWDDADQPVVSADPELTLPHPRAHLRAFVLRPWLDIQPYAQLPGYGALTDLVSRAPVVGQLAGLLPRPDMSLESGHERA